MIRKQIQDEIREYISSISSKDLADFIRENYDLRVHLEQALTVDSVAHFLDEEDAKDPLTAYKDWRDS